MSFTVNIETNASSFFTFNEAKASSIVVISACKADFFSCKALTFLVLINVSIEVLLSFPPQDNTIIEVIVIKIIFFIAIDFEI